MNNFADSIHDRSERNKKLREQNQRYLEWFAEQGKIVSDLRNELAECEEETAKAIINQIVEFVNDTYLHEEDRQKIIKFIEKLQAQE